MARVSISEDETGIRRRSSHGSVFNYSGNSETHVYSDYLQEASQPSGTTLRQRLSRHCRRCSPLSWIFSLFPILHWLPKYKVKKDLSFDILAGLTVCVMQIPQGMAYAMLANVQPVVGIYMSLFPIIVYACMGTSKHISMGTFAVTCLMAGKTVAELHGKYVIHLPQVANESEIAKTPLSDNDDSQIAYKYTPEQIATVLSLVTGGFQVIMGFLRLGTLSVILSSDLVSGFTTGAAVHVFTSQIKNLLGLKLKRRVGVFKIPLSYYDIASHVQESNVTSIVISVISLVFLFSYNELLKPYVSRKSPIPIPVELITIVVGTLVSRYWITSEQYGFPIVDEIPTGFPPPAVPPLELVKDVLIDSFILAIVAYVIAISMAKIFASKHQYSVSPNQELIANGTSNVVGSFLCCAPISCSLSRSVIQEQVGGKTQLAALVNCVVIVFVLLWIAPFFETLPLCVLSSMIVVALKGMFVQLIDVPKILRESRMNFFVWAGTFVGTVMLDIEYGLAIGVICSLLALLCKSNMLFVQLAAIHESSDGTVLMKYSADKGKQVPLTKIIRVTGVLNFATVEHFASKLHTYVPPIFPQIQPWRIPNSNMKPPQISTSINSFNSPDEFSNSSEEIWQNTRDSDSSSSPSQSNQNENTIWVILDFSGVSSVDPAAAKSIMALMKVYLRKGINLIFVGCSPPLLPVMERVGLMKTAGLDHFYPNVPSALHFMKRGLLRRRRSVSKCLPMPPQSTLVDIGTQVEEELVEDLDEFHVVGDTADYFRRLSISMSNRR